MSTNFMSQIIIVISGVKKTNIKIVVLNEIVKIVFSFHSTLQLVYEPKLQCFFKNYET